MRAVHTLRWLGTSVAAVSLVTSLTTAAFAQPGEGADEPPVAEPEAPEGEAVDDEVEEGAPGEAELEDDEHDETPAESAESDAPSEREQAAPTTAPPKEAVKAADVKHGSGSGKGDSRGSGKGDGRGRGEVDEESPLRVGDPVAKPQSVRVFIPPPDYMPTPFWLRINDDFAIAPKLSYQARFYHREGRDFVDGGFSNQVRHQARLGLLASYRQLARVFLQVHDVRAWGEESDPAHDYDADGFDLHQGYLELTPNRDVRIRLGRQEVALANERLVGRPLFLEQSRSFDGLHLRYDKGVELEAGYFLVRDYTEGEATGATSGKRHLGISNIGYRFMEELRPRIISVVDADTSNDRLLLSVGAIVEGNVASDVSLSYSAEGYYQGGDDADLNVSAWLAGFSARVTGSILSAFTPFAEVGVVLISGDAQLDDTDDTSFRSPYPRGHRIHGEMDFFINFPRDTDGRGLRDYNATIGISPGDFRITAEAHLFDAMATRADDLRHFGFESNFKVAYKFWDYGYVDVLYGFFEPGEIKRLGLNDPSLEHFFYTTARVGF